MQRGRTALILENIGKKCNVEKDSQCCDEKAIYNPDLAWWAEPSDGYTTGSINVLEGGTSSVCRPAGPSLD